MVVVGAHLDHDGTDAQGRIYNGADDNASGTAAVLAAAAAFARAAADGERPARSVLFALWNGEEKGSLGADAFVAAPQPAGGSSPISTSTWSAATKRCRIRGLARSPACRRSPPRPASIRCTCSATAIRPTSRPTLREANEAVGLTLLEDYDQGAQGLLQRSDNWPFLSRGIPALFLTTGLHPDYHTPEDDAGRIDFGKLTRVARLAARAAWIVADGAEPTIEETLMAETTQTPPLPNELPVVPLRGAVVLPMTVAPLGVSRPMSVEAVNKALAGDRMVLLLLQKSDNDEPGIDDLHRVGTVAIIRQMAKGQGGMRVLVEGVARARAEFLQTEKGHLTALIKPLPEPSERSLEIDAHVRRLQELVDKRAVARDRPLARHPHAGHLARRSAARSPTCSPACST